MNRSVKRNFAGCCLSLLLLVCLISMVPAYAAQYEFAAVLKQSSREHAEPRRTGKTGIPDPQSSVLLLSGLIGCCMRRKRTSAVIFTVQSCAK